MCICIIYALFYTLDLESKDCSSKEKKKYILLLRIRPLFQDSADHAVAALFSLEHINIKLHRTLLL